MIIYKFQIHHARYVATSPLRLLRAIRSWLTSRTWETLTQGKFELINIGKMTLDHDTAWRIVRDLNICPSCGKHVREQLWKVWHEEYEAVYQCGCGFYDSMDVS